jgi:hypothetical protein
MVQHRQKIRQALKRLLANGPLTGLPKRQADQELLLQLAASRFEAHRTYRENEVNELLRNWLQTFCAPFGIDHVTLRRCLIDARFLTRDAPGSMYRTGSRKSGERTADAAIDLEPGEVLAELLRERQTRKRQHATKPG